MKSFEEFIGAGAELHAGLWRGEISDIVNGRQLTYYSLQRFLNEKQLVITGGFIDERKPYTHNIQLPEFIGGFAYALWLQDPSFASNTVLPKEVQLLTCAVELSDARSAAERAMSQAIVAVDGTGFHAIENPHVAASAIQAVRTEATSQKLYLSLKVQYNDYVEGHKL